LEKKKKKGKKKNEKGRKRTKKEEKEEMTLKDYQTFMINGLNNKKTNLTINNLITEYNVFSDKVFLNLLTHNENYERSSSTLNNLAYDMNLHQTSFLYRLFMGFKWYISWYKLTRSKSFSIEDEFKFDGDQYFLLNNKNDEMVEREIIYEFYKSFKLVYRGLDPIGDDRFSFIHNFLVFLCFNETYLLKMNSLDNETRYQKFYELLKVFSLDGCNNQIAKELKESNYKESQTKNFIVKYFEQNLF